MIEKPNINYTRIVGASIILIAYLFYLVGLHISILGSIDESIKEVLLGLFTTSLTIYVGLIIFSAAGIIIQLVQYLAWYVSTPKNMRNQKWRK